MVCLILVVDCVISIKKHFSVSVITNRNARKSAVSSDEIQVI